MDTSVGHYKWFVNETGEEISPDPQPARRSSIVELAQGTIAKLSTTPIEVLQAASMTSTATTPLFPVVISSSKHEVLETLSPAQVKAVVSLDHSEIGMLKGGLSNSEADELIRRGKSSSDVEVLTSLSAEQVKAVTKFISAVEDAVQKASTADGSSPKIYVVKKASKSTLKGDPTSDSYVKTLSRGISNISVKRYGFENGFSSKPYLFVSFQVSFYFYRQNMSP